MLDYTETYRCRDKKLYDNKTKEIQRDAKIVIGVYSPDRYGFDDYHGYDIKRFRDTFRAIKILKNRFGPPNKYYHYLFDGATNRFGELPKSNDVAGMGKFHNAADKLLGRVVAPRAMGKNFGQ